MTTTLALNIALIPLSEGRRFYPTRLDRSMREYSRRVREACAFVETEYGRKFELRLCTVHKRRCVEITRVA